MNSIHKVTIQGKRGELYVCYNGGEMKELLLTFVPSIGDAYWRELTRLIPVKEVDIPSVDELKGPIYIMVELKTRTVNDKIAAFCMTHRVCRNSAYTPKKNERANIAQVTMSSKLLEVYFTNTDFPLSYAKSITDYIRHYNYIRDLSVNGRPVKAGFPDIYDHDYERTLDGEKLSAYRQHIIQLGWRKIDGIWRSPNTL